jgi:hypothetical protein
MKQLSFLAAIVLLAACASSDRVVTHHERVCAPVAGVRYIDLKRNRFGDGEVRPLPELQRDFFRRAIEASKIRNAREALTTTVNDYLNERLDDLNARRFNTIYIAVDGEHAVGVTPAIHGEKRDIVMLWIDDAAMIFDGSGKLLSANPEQIGFFNLPPAKETFETSATLARGSEVCSSEYASR